MTVLYVLLFGGHLQDLVKGPAATEEAGGKD
jgi:hypothetical protein